MKAKEFVPAFAEATGLPPGTAKVADRSLADAGLRAKGRGPTPPDVSRQDAIRLLLGVTWCPALSRAGELVPEVASFTLLGWNDVDNHIPATIGIDHETCGSASLLGFLARLCGNLAELDEAALRRFHIDVEVEALGYVKVFVQGTGFEAAVTFSGREYPAPKPVLSLHRIHLSVLRWIGAFPSEAVD